MNSCCAEAGYCFEPKLLNFGAFGSNYQTSPPNHGIKLTMLLYGRIGKAKFDDLPPGCDSESIL